MALLWGPLPAAFLLMTLCLLVVLLPASSKLFLHAHAETNTDGELPNFASMRVKQLRELLTERGVECVGCVEKEHFVDKVKESYHLPVISAAERAAAAAAAERAARGPEEKLKDLKGKDDKDLKKILDSLKVGGFGDNIKVFSREDFENIATNINHDDKLKDEL